MYPRETEPHHRPHRPEGRSSNVVAGVLAVLLLLVAGALVYTVTKDREQRVVARPALALEARTVTPRGDLASDEQSTIELFQRTSPSVVHVTNLVVRRSGLSMNVFEIPQGTGSGFLWDASGHVVTNFHVVKGSDRAEVTLSDGTKWKATIVGVEPDKDLAVLEIKAPADKLRGLALGTSRDLQVGQKVFAIGNPFGLDQTLTTGIISGLDREIKSISGRPIEGVIQTDAAINQGNSGGPLLDSSGRLIGVNTAILSPSGTSAGVGFAVPVDTVNRIVPQLIAHGHVERPGLGIVPVPDRVARSQRFEGVVIEEVPAGSAGAKAGLVGVSPGPTGGWLVGDVIVALGGKPVRETDDLYRILDSHKVGDKVELEVVREGSKRKVDITLQALPAER
jgi:S1-C subfamily serine protease